MSQKEELKPVNYSPDRAKAMAELAANEIRWAVYKDKKQKTLEDWA